MTWYKDWFGEDYLKVYPHRDQKEAEYQVDFVRKALQLSHEDLILDLGCGNGRHANELASRGFKVTCLDLSPVLLRLAKKARRKVCCSRFVQADMRQIPFCGVFDSVLSFFTTFGYFDTDSENLRTLHSIEQAMKPGGTFFQDYLNKDHVIANLVPSDEKVIEDVRITQERRYDEEKERVEKKITIQSDGIAREYYESVRLYTIDEMRVLLARTGLELLDTYGDFDGRAFTEESPRLILTGKRKI